MHQLFLCEYEVTSWDDLTIRCSQPRGHGDLVAWVLEVDT